MPDSASAWTPAPEASGWTPAPAAADDKPGAVARFLQPLNPMPLLEQVFKPSGDHAQDLSGYTMGKNILGIVHGLGMAQTDMGKKAIEAFKKGDHIEAFAKGLAALTPILGPMSQEAADKFTSGDIAGGMGSLTAMAAPEITHELTGPIGDALGKVAEPINKVRNAKATSLMKGALNLRRDTSPETGAALAKTALDNKLSITKAAPARLDAKVQAIESEMQPTIDAADDRGVTVDRLQASAPITKVENDFAHQVDPVKDLAKIKAVGDNFMKADYERSEGTKPGKPAGPPEPSGVLDSAGKPIMKPGTPEVPATPAEPIPASVAQKVKRGTYRKVSDEYGNLSTSEVEANKAIAHGIKEKMDAAIPELREFNDSQGKLLDLKPVLEHAVNTAANRSSGLFKGAATSVAVKAISGSEPIALTASAAQKVFSSPALRSRVAIIIYKAEQANPKPGILPSMARATTKATAYLSTLAKESVAKQDPADADSK